MILRHIDAALAQLPEAEAGTQIARDYREIERLLLAAKARATTLIHKPARAGSPDAWRG